MRAVLSWSCRVFVCGFATLLLATCNQSPNPPAASPASGDSEPAASTTQPEALRLVSLSPALSRTLVDFGLADRVIGCTPHCTAIDPSVPRVGDLNNVDLEALVRLKPTHLLVQPPSSGINPNLEPLGIEHGWKVCAWRLNGVDDVMTMIGDLPDCLFNADTELKRQARQRADAMLADIVEAMSPGEHHIFSGSIMVVSSVAPILAAGKGTYIGDMLDAFGAVNAVEREGWIELSLEDVATLNPKAIVIIKPTASPESSVWDYAGRLTELTVEGMLLRRLALVRHPDALMPSSALADVARELRSHVHSFIETPIE